MSQHTRRTVLGGGTAAMVTMLGACRAVEAEPAGAAEPASGPVTIGRGDPRYKSFVNRGYNRRFEGTPDHVRVVTSTRDVVRAVEEAVRAGKPISVRSGGHCFEDFVDNARVRVVIDLCGMTEVSFDRERRAFAVEAGATLGDVYQRLYTHWGVTIPAGTNALVGVGGHVQGGGYGALNRLHGLTVDHLYAVEVVVVDKSGKARAVVATRDASDPNRELWWAHTGGGGGNFGVVTRYWFRSPGSRGSDPGELLPNPPSSVLQFTLTWDWKQIDQRKFTALVDSYGRWAERNAGAGSPGAVLYGEFVLSAASTGALSMAGQVSSTSAPERQLDRFVSALGVPPERTARTVPWLTATHGLTTEPGPVYRLKIKSGYPRRRFTPRQVEALYRNLTQRDTPMGGLVSVNLYGGKVNTVPPTATAMPHRDSILVLAYIAGWLDPAHDKASLSWIRKLYREVYADTGGVPSEDGTFINYPDTDLADPKINTSPVPWHKLYYKDSYTRLQRAKSHWDPRGVFTHPLSIKPA
ncbi:FAD-binding oxidoreductase [Spirillospora sp. CA-294931]|uniref:FAD-binding oxidoreductase n=1 Tax=Spirillospora sp. CA-294931 TaxID=3240042 RepID=UPI003D94FDAA